MAQARASFQSPRSHDTPIPTESTHIQHLPPSVLQLIANALAPPVLKHTYRPPSYRPAHRTLLAAATTCHALRTACFPVAAQIMRSPGLRPQAVADLGESVRELEAKVDFVLDRVESVGALVRKVDIEIYARAPPRLVSKLVKLFSTLPNLTFIALKLPTYHVFRDALISDLRRVMQDDEAETRLDRITELCVDARLSWMLEHVPNVRELVVWSWPSDVDREGGLTAEETVDGWRTFLARFNAQAPNVEQVEVGGLSVYDANELFPSLSNYTPFSSLTTLRILHRKEEHGALPLPSPYIPSALDESITDIWDETGQEQSISGRAGAVKRIVYFDLQDECASCYVPGVEAYLEDQKEGKEGECGGDGAWWEDDAPAVVLSCVKAKWES